MRHAGHLRRHYPQRNSTSHSLCTPQDRTNQKPALCVFFSGGKLHTWQVTVPAAVCRMWPAGYPRRRRPGWAPLRYSLCTPKNLTDQKPPPPSPCAPKHPTWWVAMAHLRPLLAVPPPKWPVAGGGHGHAAGRASKKSDGGALSMLRHTRPHQTPDFALKIHTKQAHGGACVRCMLGFGS